MKAEKFGKVQKERRIIRSLLKLKGILESHFWTPSCSGKAGGSSGKKSRKPTGPLEQSRKGRNIGATTGAITFRKAKGNLKGTNDDLEERS